MKTFIKIFYFCLIGIVIIFVCGWFMRFSIASKLLTTYNKEAVEKYITQSPETHLKKFLPTITKDAHVLSQYEIFTRGSKGKSDAAPALNPLIGWNGNEGPLTLSSDILKLKDNENFTVSKPDWKKLNLDFSWFKKLKDFDYWSFDEFGPMYSGNDKFKVFDFPIPNYHDLVLWSKLRLLYGRDHNDIANALIEVQHLAQLIMSNENLVSSMSTISLLKSELIFYKSLTENDQKKISKLIINKIPTESELNIAKRFFFAQGHFTDLRLTNELFLKLSKLTPGLCPRVNSAIEQSIGYRRLLKGEMDDGYERINTLVKNSEKLCRNSFLRKAWVNPDYQGLFDKNTSIFEAVNFESKNKSTSSGVFKVATIEQIERHPTLAHALVFSLLTMAQPSFLKEYEKSIATNN